MPIDAMGAGFHIGTSPPASAISGIIDSLKVLRITATSMRAFYSAWARIVSRMADVIDLEAIGDWAVAKLVDKAMGEYGYPSTKLHSSITVLSARAKPRPAGGSATAVIRVLQEALNRRLNWVNIISSWHASILHYLREHFKTGVDADIDGLLEPEGVEL